MITDVYQKYYKQIINFSFYFRNNSGKRRVKTTSVHHATSPTSNPFTTSLVHQLLPFLPSQLTLGQCSGYGLASHPFSVNPPPVCKPPNDYSITLI